MLCLTVLSDHAQLAALRRPWEGVCDPRDMAALRRTVVVEARCLPDLPDTAFPACAQPTPAAAGCKHEEGGRKEGGGNGAGQGGRGSGAGARGEGAGIWAVVREGLEAALRRALGPIAAARPSAAELAEDFAVLARAAAAADAAETTAKAAATAEMEAREVLARCGDAGPGGGGGTAAGVAGLCDAVGLSGEDAGGCPLRS